MKTNFFILPYLSHCRSWVVSALVCSAAVISPTALGQLMISGNENKIDLNPGAPTVVQNAKSDSLTILDFSEFPPIVDHLMGIENTVIGPPSNIAISPIGNLALIANSLKIDPNDPTQYVPESFAHILDLNPNSRKVTGRVATGQQPSGLSFSPDGRLAIVANRAEGSVSVLRVIGNQVSNIATVDLEVSTLKDSAADVAISPDGKIGLVSIQNAGYLAVLEISGESVTVNPRKISVHGKPYRVVITPDGKFGVTGGGGFGDPDGLDADCISIVDMKTLRATDHIPVGSLVECLEVSPNGQLIAAVLMDGSNLAADHPNRTQAGGLAILARKGENYELSHKIPCGRIPEGVAFTSDGKYLVVQSHPARQLEVYRVRGKKVKPTKVRITTPGFPSSLRAAN